MQAVNAKYKNEEKKIPNLRFPGFKGEWEIKIFGDLTQDASYGMNSAAIEFDGINKYLRITDIDEKSRKFVPKPLTSPNGELEDKYRLKMGDIVFARTGASVGKCYLYNDFDGNLYYAGFLIKFSIKEYAEPYFIYSYTFGSNYMKWVQVMSMRSGQPGINSEEYKSLEFYVPSLPEQQEIASFLSAVDQKIQQLIRKKELLEQYKKGVMQKIFSREIRFRDENGNDYPDWEEKRLGDIAQVKGGKRIPKGHSLQKEDNGFPYITVSDMNNGGVSLENIKFVPEEIAGAIKNYTISFLDIYVSVAGTLGLVGIIPPELENANLTENANKLTDIKCNQQYLLQFLGSQAFTKLINTVKTDNAQPKLAIYALNGFVISLPVMEEQVKIALFLSNIDNKIESIQTQITQTQQFKKGLLQQMFV